MKAEANIKPKARNVIDRDVRIKVKKYTQSIVRELCSKKYGYSYADIAEALELGTTRTVADWAKDSKAVLPPIPTKQSFLQLCLIKLQIDYIPSGHKSDLKASSVLKYAAVPILLNSAIRAGAGGALGGLLGGALGGLGIGTLALGPIGLIIGLAALNEYQSRSKAEAEAKSREEMIHFIELIQAHTQGNHSWHAILRIVERYEKFILN